MRGFDFSSWQAIATTILGLALITIIGVGVRLLAMMTIQQRRERENRQINERLRTLIAAYKTLGGSFTGDLSVDPTHLRDLRRRAAAEADDGTELEDTGSDRSRRIRDAVEAALADIILLGTDEQVQLATQAAQELVAGRPVHTAELVVALRDFIRQALGLDAVAAGVGVPSQGPARTAGSGRGGGERSGERAGRGGGRGGGGGAMGAGGAGLGAGLAVGARSDEAEDRG